MYAQYCLMARYMTTMAKNFVKFFCFFIPSLIFADDIDEFIKTKTCVKCDLSNARFVGDLQYAIADDSLLTNCEFIYSNFDKSNLNNCFLTKSQAQSFWNPYFYSQATFREASFRGAFLNFTNFSSVEFSGANFENANLKNANFENANFSNANFQGAVLDDANFKNTILIGSNITEEQLSKLASKECAILPDGSLYTSNENIKCLF
jgi:uncharacterized protein YjbI with pentapeptide repeats